jgi:hypothetical protein
MGPSCKLVLRATELVRTAAVLMQIVEKALVPEMDIAKKHTVTITGITRRNSEKRLSLFVLSSIVADCFSL